MQELEAQGASLKAQMEQLRGMEAAWGEQLQQLQSQLAAAQLGVGVEGARALQAVERVASGVGSGVVDAAGGVGSGAWSVASGAGPGVGEAGLSVVAGAGLIVGGTGGAAAAFMGHHHSSQEQSATMVALQQEVAAARQHLMQLQTERDDAALALMSTQVGWGEEGTRAGVWNTQNTTI